MFNLPEGHRDIRRIPENIMAVASRWQRMEQFSHSIQFWNGMVWNLIVKT